MKNLNKKYVVTSWIITALVIVAVILLNLIASSLTTKFNLKLDLTESNQYEISNITNTSIGTVKSRIARARNIIKNKVNSYARG